MKIARKTDRWLFTVRMMEVTDRIRDDVMTRRMARLRGAILISIHILPTLVLCAGILCACAEAEATSSHHALDTNKDGKVSWAEANASAIPTAVYQTRATFAQCPSCRFDMRKCIAHLGGIKGTPAQIQCQLFETPLQTAVPWKIEGAHYHKTNEGRIKNLMCQHQQKICAAQPLKGTPGGKETPRECIDAYRGCQGALRHLHAMMFKNNFTEQQCNNFALKSVRGFFHDFMSSAIDGSLLGELDLPMNVGLCRWSQYVNVLSDETGCDTGSIIAMSGQLGFEACGVQLWRLDQDAFETVDINRGQRCGAPDAIANKENPTFWDSNTQRRVEAFDDAAVATNSSSYEDFWCSVQPHPCGVAEGRPDGLDDGEIEYSTEATASAHVIGRVTCPIEGHRQDGSKLKSRPGFFHLPRGQEKILFDGSKAKSGLLGKDQLRARFSEGKDHLKDTQCIDKGTGVPFANCKDSGSDCNVPINPLTGKCREGYCASKRYETADGLRKSTSKWPLTQEETNFNSIDGACGMPNHFLGTVKIGNQHRTARFMVLMSNGHYKSLGAPAQDYSRSTQNCTSTMRMFLPLELSNISHVERPSSPALQKFLDIAWNGVDTTNSAWDSCAVGGCEDLDLRDNKMCGGAGLSNFQWKGYVPQPVQNVPDCDAGFNWLEWSDVLDNWSDDVKQRAAHGASGKGGCPFHGDSNARTPSPSPSLEPSGSSELYLGMSATDWAFIGSCVVGGLMLYCVVMLVLKKTCGRDGRGGSHKKLETSGSVELTIPTALDEADTEGSDLKPLPEGWAEAQDEQTGKTFYYRQDSVHGSSTTWDRPTKGSTSI